MSEHMFDPSYEPERYGWLEGLSNRAAHCILNIGYANHLQFESKEDFKAFVEKIGPGHLRKYRMLGKKSQNEILSWLGLPTTSARSS